MTDRQTPSAPHRVDVDEPSVSPRDDADVLFDLTSVELVDGPSDGGLVDGPVDGGSPAASATEVAPSGGLALVDAAVMRLVDMTAALVLLVVLSPVMIVVTAAVLATSPGPALFRQQRCGRRGQPFTMLKFRTMTADAEQQAVALADESEVARVDAPAFKSPDDPRVTPLGRVLRRTTIDELPQLVNVLLGQMALVGPRPLVHSEADVLSAEAFALRHRVRPGLTGQWQVDRVVDTTFDERMSMDLEYAATRTVARDVGLLLRTPASIVRGAGCF